MILENLESYLQSSLPTVAIRMDALSPTPDTQVVIMGIGGKATIRSSMVEQDYKILVRSATYTTAYSTMNSVYTLLQGAGNVLATPTQIIKAISTPYYIGRDENQRALFSCNFMVRSNGL